MKAANLAANAAELAANAANLAANAAELAANADELAALRKDKESFENKTLSSLRQEVADRCRPGVDATGRRQTQGADGNSTVVRIFTRQVSLSHLSGNVDESNGGHRLVAEAGGTAADCSSAEIARQVDLINKVCCDEPTEMRSGGTMHTCNAGCGALLMPLWEACRANLGPTVAQAWKDAAALCAPAAAHHFLAMCPPNEHADIDCIPTCNEDTHGFFLLLGIDGTDTILICELVA